MRDRFWDVMPCLERNVGARDEGFVGEDTSCLQNLRVMPPFV